jgi:cell division septation protein DedD
MKNKLIQKIQVGRKKIKNLLSRKNRSNKKYTYMLLSLIPIVLFQNCEQSSAIKSVSDAVQVVSSSRSQPAMPAPSPSSSPTPTATPGPVASPTPVPSVSPTPLPSVPPTPTPTPVLTKSMEKNL